MPIAWSSGKDKNFYTMSKLKVLEQPKANSKNRNHDRKIRSQTKGICYLVKSKGH